MLFHRFTVAVEVIGLAAALAFVVMLFTNQPSVSLPARIPVQAGAPAATLDPAQAKQLYVDACSSCHGEEAEGIYGPALSGDHSTTKYPKVDDEVDVVSKGLGQMRSFSKDMTPEQIRSVVEYVRSLPTKGD